MAQSPGMIRRSGQQWVMDQLFRIAWHEDPFTFDGEFTTAKDIRLLPKPVGPIPIWVGGGSEAAFRRAVRAGDGFQAIGLDPEQAAATVRRLRMERPEESFTISLRTGWDPQGMDHGRIREERVAYEEAGIQHVVAAPWQKDEASWLRSMELLIELVAA